MKHLLCIFILFLTLSCKHSTTTSRSSQDSLIIILKTQIKTLQEVPVYSKEKFSLNDTLSYKDSLLYNTVLQNYELAINTMDSIRHILPQIINESNQLTPFFNIQDTQLIHRLEYLTKINALYLEEYQKATAIAEQNKTLLKILSTTK